MTVRVYTKLPCVHLTLNGRNASHGCTPAGVAHGYTASFSVPFSPGILTAVAHDPNSRDDAVDDALPNRRLRSAGHASSRRSVAESSLHTPGPAVGLRLLPDKRTLTASRDDLCFVTVEIIDAQGRLVTCGRDAQPYARLNPAPIPIPTQNSSPTPDPTLHSKPNPNLRPSAQSSPRAPPPSSVSGLRCVPPTLFFSVTGPGSLEAVGSADPNDVSSFSAEHRTTYRGRALAILRPGAVGVPLVEGVVRLTVVADGLASASVNVRVVG